MAVSFYFLKTTVEHFWAVQIEPGVQIHVVLFTSFVYVGGATCLLMTGQLPLWDELRVILN